MLLYQINKGKMEEIKEKPFKKEELSDVYLWNKKHGWMWIIYGIIILLSYGIGFIIGIDSVMCVIPMCGGIIIPIPVMIWKHHRLIKEMKIKQFQIIIYVA